MHSLTGLNEKGLESVNGVGSDKFCENMIPVVT